MAETAADLLDHVFKPSPARQWALSVPKRLRWDLEREPKAVSALWPMFLCVIEMHLHGASDGSFVHRGHRPEAARCPLLAAQRPLEGRAHQV